MTTHVHLVLASGGMRCVSYVGAVTALADHGVEVNTVSACSAGSFIGALLSAGMSAHEVQDCILVLDVVWLAGTPAHPAFFGRLLALRRWPFARYTESGMPDFFRTAVGADPTLAELRKPFATLGIDIVARRILVYSSRTTPQMKVSPPPSPFSTRPTRKAAASLSTAPSRPSAPSGWRRTTETNFPSSCSGTARHRPGCSRATCRPF
jgi:predicted acylesterase/phospholipase RssA